MPNIPQYNSNVAEIPQANDRAMSTARESASTKNIFSREAGQGLGRAITEVGGQFGKQADAENFRRAQEAEQHQVHAQISAGAANYSALYGDLTLGWNETAAKAPLNDTSIAQGFKEHTLEPSLEKFRRSYDNSPEVVQKWADDQVAKTRQHFTEKMIADSSTRSGAAIHENINNVERNWSNVAMVDPSSMQFAIDSAKSAVDNLVDTAHNLTPADAARVRAELLPKMEKSIAHAAFDAMAQANPKEAVAKLAHGDFDKYIDGAQKATWQKYAETQQKTQEMDARRDAHEAKEARKELSSDTAQQYMQSMYDPNNGRMLRPDPKLNQKIMNDPNMLPAEKTAAIRWNQTQFKAQVREDKEAAAGNSVRDNAPLLADLRQRVNSVENPVTRQEVIDALGGEQITRKSAADLMWRVGQQDAAWKAVDQPFQHQFSSIRHALTSSIAGQTNPEKTAQQVNVIEANAQRTLRQLFDAKDTAGLRDALDPTSKSYVLRPELVKPASARDNVAEEAAKVRKGTLNPPKRFANEDEVKAANLPDGTAVIVNGKPAVWKN